MGPAQPLLVRGKLLSRIGATDAHHLFEGFGFKSRDVYDDGILAGFAYVSRNGINRRKIMYL